MGQIVCYPESTFGQRMEVTCVWLNGNWFSSLAIYASTNVQHIWRQCTENGHEYKGNWALKVLVWSPIEARGSCTYEVLHLLKLLQKLHVGSQAPMTAQSWKEGGESEETCLRPILNKSHHWRWAEFAPKKFLFSWHFSVGRVRLSICIGFLPWPCKFSGVEKMVLS